MSTVLSENRKVMTLLPRGYTTRPATMADAEAVVALINAYSQSMVGQNSTNAEKLRLAWGVPGFDMTTDTRMVLMPDGQLVGYMEVQDTHALHVRMRCWGCVHPNYRMKGIGSHLVEWAEARALRFVPEAPEGVLVVLQSEVLSSDVDAQAVLRMHEFMLTRHFCRMVVTFDGVLPVSQWPDGITVRTLTLGQDERAMVRAVEEAFKDHWGYVSEPFEKTYERWMHWINEDPAFDPTLWFLAIDGDDIAGACLCLSSDSVATELGHVSTLGVRRPWRRRGLGLALLTHAFRELCERGKLGVSLGVDASSLTGATRLYEKAGMQIARQHCVFEKQLRPGENLMTQSVE